MERGTKLYCVCQVSRNIGVKMMGVECDAPLMWAKGMIGAIPVFDNEDDALAEAGDKYQVLVVTTLASTAKQEAAGEAKGGKGGKIHARK